MLSFLIADRIIVLRLDKKEKINHGLLMCFFGFLNHRSENSSIKLSGSLGSRHHYFSNSRRDVQKCRACLAGEAHSCLALKSSDFLLFENRQMSQSRASKNNTGTTRILRKKRRRREIFSQGTAIGGRRRERTYFLLLEENGTGAEKQNALTVKKRKDI